MNTVGPFVDRGDTCVAIGLFDPVFAQVTIAPKNLHPQLCCAHACLGAIDLRQRCQKLNKRRIVTAFHRDTGQMGNCTRAQCEPIDLIDHAAYIGMLVDGDRRALGAASLLPFGSITGCDIIGPRRMCNALKGDVGARVVHHSEHRSEALPLITDQFSLGIVKSQLARR